MPPDPGPPTTPPPRTELVVLAGLPTEGTERLARLLLAVPGTVVVHHDLRDVGRGLVRRRVRQAGSDTTTPVRLAHGCVSCTMREDLLPLLLELARSCSIGPARRVVLHLDPVLEPEQVCWALAHVLVDGHVVTDELDLRGVVTAVDAASWFTDATGEESVDERGLAELPDDERTVAQVATGQAEFADLVVVGGAASAWELARTDAVLARLAPAARQIGLAELTAEPSALLLADLPAEARRGRPDDVHGPLLRGRPPLDSDCGVELVVFTARRPFHPQRLHDAIDVLLDGVVRTRGRVWLATRPGDVLWLESAGGGLRIGQAGDWLADADENAWEAADPERRALAALGWHERFGDRCQDIVVLAHAADPAEIESALHAALLTDAELAGGEAMWAQLPDPFGWWHTDPCGSDTPAHVAADHDHGSRGEDD